MKSDAITSVQDDQFRSPRTEFPAIVLEMGEKNAHYVMKTMVYERYTVILHNCSDQTGTKKSISGSDDVKYR